MSDFESLKLTKNKNKIADLNILKGSLGPDVIDIRQLYNQTGFFTYDPSYGATSSCESSITFIDGDKGILLGYNPLSEDSIVMVDDVITDGFTKVESVKLIKELCEKEVKGVIVALDRMEKNSKGIDSITQFQHSTNIPVYSIINIKEILDYLKIREYNDSFKLEESVHRNIEDYFSRNCI